MKKILALLFAFVMVFSLCACHKDDKDEGPEYANKTDSTTISNNLKKFEGKKLFNILSVVEGGYFYLQTEFDGTLATYTHMGNDIMLTLDTTDNRYNLVKMADGTYYFADKRGYFEVTDAILEQNPGYKATIDSCKDALATLDAIPIAWWTLEPTDGINVTLKNVASHEEYIDKYSSTSAVVCFLYDSNGDLMGMTNLGSGDSKTTPEVITMTFGAEDPNSNAISNIFTRTNYAEATTAATAQ